MASSINPNNIDGTYPIAGQDNDSQGFRDNFTNSKNNFSFAKTEIEDIQGKVVLKSALTGAILTNAFGGTVMSDAEIVDFSETIVAKGSVTGSVTFNHNEAHYQTVASSGSLTFDFALWPVTTKWGRITVEVDITNVAHTITLPAEVTIGLDNIVGRVASIITFGKIGKYMFRFSSHDGGGTVAIEDLTIRGNSDVQGLSGAGAINLSTKTTQVTTTGTDALTLADGVEGQEKFVVMVAIVGDGTLAPDSLGNGTNITFDTVGDSAHLLFTGSNWYFMGGTATLA